jgi:hypothetical protein
MGAKPKQTKSVAKTVAKRTPARRVPARKTAGVTKSVKTGSGKTVDAYVGRLEGWQAEAAERLRQVVREVAPSLTESIKWGQPVYEDNGPVCYFRGNADHLTFGFWRGTELDDPDFRLEGEGDRMKHIKIHAADEVSEELLGGWIRQAIELNQRLGNPTAAKSVAPRDTVVEERQSAIPMIVAVEPVEPVVGPDPGTMASDDGWQDEFHQ